VASESEQGATQETLRDRFSRASRAEQGEFEVALLVAETIDDDFDSEHARTMFSELIEPLLESSAEAIDAGSGVHAADGLLQGFRQAGFGMPQRAQVGLQHSNLAWVMEHRQGIPISLAVLLIEAGRRSGLGCHGVNYPGHFLVSIEGQLVDPVHMRPMDLSQLAGNDFDVQNAPDLMQQTTPKMLALRMLNNVKAYHLGRRSWSQALEMIDYQLAAAGEDRTGQDKALCASLYYERGEFWEQLGGFAAAAEAYQKCSEISPYKELARKAQMRAVELSSRNETLH
jgi:regulator of sirC expression with transglutaminase-like and TPR domain